MRTALTGGQVADELDGMVGGTPDVDADHRYRRVIWASDRCGHAVKVRESDGHG